MALKYVTRFTVTGTGEFPVDMLRYDGCHPRSEQDSYKITATFQHRARTEPRSPIELTMYHEHMRPRITPERWESFLWHVDYKSIQTDRLP